MELFTYEQAMARGLSKGGLDRALRSGRIRRVLPGAYVDAEVADSPELRAEAFGLSCPGGVAAYLRSAAWLHGLDVLPPGRTITDWPWQLVVPAGRTPPRRAGCQGYQAPLSAEDVMEINGVLVTTPVRTALDWGRLLPRLEAQAAVDRIVAERPGLLEPLTAAVEGFAGR